MVPRLWAGSSRAAPSPAACQTAGSQLPSVLQGRRVPPPAAREAAPAQLQQGTGQPGPGAAALRSWHTVGFLANWLPGGRLSGTGAVTSMAAARGVTAWPASAELCLLALKEQVPEEVLQLQQTSQRHLKGNCSNSP